MAHIFFEKLENRRSTQSLFSGYSTPGSTVQAIYAAPTNQVATYYGVMQPSTSYPPSSSTGSYPWGGWGYGYGTGYGTGYGYGYGFNPYGFGGYNLFNPLPLWNNPFNSYPYSYSSPWTSPFSNLWSGVNNLLSPVWNILGGLFGLQSSPWPVYPGYPGYPGSTSPGQVLPPYGVQVPLYAAQVPSPTLLYGINLPTTTSSYTPSTSYSPPSSSVWALYGVSVSQPTTSYWP